MTTKELFQQGADALKGVSDGATLEVVVLPLPKGVEGGITAVSKALIETEYREVERVQVKDGKLVLVAR